MKKADPRLMLIMSMTVFGTLGLFVRNIPVSSGEQVAQLMRDTFEIGSMQQFACGNVMHP